MTPPPSAYLSLGPGEIGGPVEPGQLLRIGPPVDVIDMETPPARGL